MISLTNMGILPNCSCVNTTVWLHHLNFNKTFREKVNWKLHRDTGCYFEQTLPAAPHKTTLV